MNNASDVHLLSNRRLMKRMMFISVAVTFVLSGWALSNPKSSEISLLNIPYTWSVDQSLAKKLSVEIPHNEFANQATDDGAKAQVIVYYTPKSGNRVAFMSVYYFPKVSFEAANRANEPPPYGNKLLEENGMILSSSGPQDSIFEPATEDGKNISKLYRDIYHAKNYRKVPPIKVNTIDADTVSGWITSVSEKVASALPQLKPLNPLVIGEKTAAIKNGFADGDAGLVEQKLRGAHISFTLNDTQKSRYIYLDSSYAPVLSPITSNNSIQPILGCFVATLKSDTYKLEITEQNGLQVKGLISINNAQKDSSNGEFVGTFDGTILTGIYTFVSEGSTSRREIFFKATNRGFVTGYGPVVVSGDLEKLKRPLSLQWDGSYVYSAKKSCK